MGIKIVTQTNEQECGVCALTSLHNHFYSQTISKEEALEQSNVNDNGMTIFDFETLAAKLGMECESYEIKFAEFINLKISKYFVLLVSTGGNNNHYVIARKQKKFIEIYDSCSLQMNKISYGELKQIFLNVIILVKKQPNKLFNKFFGKTSVLLMFDLKFVLINLGLSVLIMAVAIGSASFLNFIIDLAIGKGSINNLITMCFIFVLLYFMNDILTYISNLYVAKHVKNYFILFTSKILTSLETKRPDFFNKVDKNWIFKIDECVYNIANFSIVEINKFITNIIFCFICICIIGSIQYYLLIFVVVYALIEVIFFLFSYRKKQEVFLNIIRSENNNATYYKQLIVSLSNEMWFTKRKTLIERIKNNYSNIYKNYSNVILFKSNSTLFKSLLKSFCEVGVICLMSVMIIKENKITIGQLTFVISAFSLYKTSTADLCNYFLLKLEFNVYWQVYKDLTTISNIETSKIFNLPDEIKTLTIKFNGREIKLDTKLKFNNIGVSIIEALYKHEQILINNKEITWDKGFVDSLIIVDQHSTSDSKLLISKFELAVELYGQYLRYFNIDLNKTNPSFYEGLIINLLTLLSETNKIIFIDDIFQYIKKKDIIVVKQILNKVKRTNTIFILGKEDND